MLSLLNADFFQQYGLLIVLAVALAFLMFISFNRRKREETNRVELNKAVAPGSKVKTYGGIYGKVVSIEETTDGKIVLLETGEGKRVSYQSIHINAIYGLDDKKPVILDGKGEEVFPDLDKLEAERLAEQKQAEETKEEPVAKAKTTKKKTTK